MFEVAFRKIDKYKDAVKWCTYFYQEIYQSLENAENSSELTFEVT